MAKPKKPITVGPITVERHDEEDGTIAYELWDANAKTFHRICRLDDEDNRHAKHDAEMLARAANNLLGQRG